MSYLLVCLLLPFLKRNPFETFFIHLYSCCYFNEFIELRCCHSQLTCVSSSDHQLTPLVSNVWPCLDSWMVSFGRDTKRLKTHQDCDAPAPLSLSVLSSPSSFLAQSLKGPNTILYCPGHLVVLILIILTLMIVLGILSCICYHLRSCLGHPFN